LNSKHQSSRLRPRSPSPSTSSFRHRRISSPSPTGTVAPIVIVIDLAAGCSLLRAPPARARLAHRRLLSAPRARLAAPLLPALAYSRPCRRARRCRRRLGLLPSPLRHQLLRRRGPLLPGQDRRPPLNKIAVVLNCYLKKLLQFKLEFQFNFSVHIS
jgi:hypothetical protein